MDFTQRMESKWEEITVTKNERELLFDNFEANKECIAELHYEVEIKQLQYLFLKREQLAGLKEVLNTPDLMADIEKINETCISIAQKHLVEAGLKERLVLESLI
ncbi:hypothetical protein [Paenibacillus sp. IHBB 10380]|uniref:hypothetical protein n=1 Tax=Paenibacillus sp. IHBB 10380 TaxID=1566358 RepID=UPI0005CFC067|nr:hypothetical protein [Paenibacillus sp. IHBB 10380]AJS59190.1 hypothetical protein UB51_12745 [Paenibacillus sp. IHBB 10380]